MVRKRLLQNLIAVVVVAAVAVFPQGPALAVGEQHGPYLLTTLVDGVPLCMDNPASTSNGTVMTISTCHGGANQQWTNEVRDRYSYWTFSEYGEKCLTVHNSSRQNDAAIIQFTCNDGPNERWVYDPVSVNNTIILIVGGRQYSSNKAFQIKNVNSSRCITVKHRQHVAGNTLLQYTCSSPGLNQWVQFPIR